MEFKGKTPTPKKKNFNYRNQSSQKNNQSEKKTLILPQIGGRYMIQRKKSHIKSNNIYNLSSILNPIQQPKIIYINSISGARLPDEFYDLSFDNPQNW